MPTPLKVSFVCSGNICRSPMAERILLHEAAIAGRSARSVSMGTLGIVGRSAARNAVIALKEIDIDLSHHRSQGMSLAVLSACQDIFVMEEMHRTFIQKMAPHLTSRIHMLGEWDPEDRRPEIDDPVNQDLDAFRFSRDRIQRAVRHYLKFSALR